MIKCLGGGIHPEQMGSLRKVKQPEPEPLPPDEADLATSQLTTRGAHKALLNLLGLGEEENKYHSTIHDGFNTRVARLLVSFADRAERKGLGDDRIACDQIDSQRLECYISATSARITLLINTKAILPSEQRNLLLKELTELGAHRRMLESCRDISNAQFGMRPSAIQVFGALALSRDMVAGIDSEPAKASLRQMTVLYMNSDHKDLFWVGDPSPYHRAVEFGPDRKNILKMMASILDRNFWTVLEPSVFCEQLGLPVNDLSKQVVKEALGIFKFFRLIP